MQDLQLVLIGIGALAIAGLIIHGVWASKRESQNRNRYLEQTSQSATKDVLNNDVEDDPLLDGSDGIEDAEDDNEELVTETISISDDMIPDPFASNVEDDKTEEAPFITVHKSPLGVEQGQKKADEASKIYEQSHAATEAQLEAQAIAPETVEPEPEPEEPNILLLHVKATGESFFDGQALVASMKRYGLAFGKNDIYHCYENSHQNSYEKSDANNAIFSVANMLNPGTFPLSPTQNFETKGILLFMILSGDPNSEQHFKKMLLTAQEIADDLGGHVLDDKRNLMTPNRLDLYRQQIRESLAS